MFMSLPGKQKSNKFKRRLKTIIKRHVPFVVLFILILSFLILGRQFVFISSRPTSPLPQTTSNQSAIPVLGASASGRLLQVEKALTIYNIPFLSVTASSDSAILVALEEGTVLLSWQKPIELQISSLQHALSRFTIEGKKISFLDFRFERPIVVFH